MRILSQYPHVLSVTFGRCQAACLVARMGHLVEAARERRAAIVEGVRMWEEAAAYHAAHIRGRGRWGIASCRFLKLCNNR